MDQTTARPARRAKPAGRKTANRFAMLAGGDTAPSTDPSPATDSAASEEGTGLIAGMSAIVANEAHRVVQIHVAEVAPHPFNDPRRSQPQPGDPKWEELLNGVRASGVRLPVLVVTREAFLAARPSAADIATDTRYVLVYGHRRRVAAIEAGRDTIPAVVDDAIMDDDGDLDAMATENLGRQDLSDLAEGELYARYSEIGLSQRAIAERLGVDQATVSRKLALKLLAPEIRDAVDDGRLPSAEAAALAGKLPYGPLRRWQKTKDPDQLSDLRHREQMQALHLILTRGMIATRAAERVIAERTARAKADELGIPLVEDPRAELGENYHLHRVADYEPGAEVIGAINPASGAVDLYARHLAGEGLTSTTSRFGNAAAADPADQPGAPEVLDPPTESDALPPREETNQDPDQRDEPSPEAAQRQADAQSAAQAQRARREFCAALIYQQPSNAELLKILVAQYLSGVAARSATSAVSALLRDWDATADGPAEKARNARAWHRAVAAAELHTAELKDKAWDDAAAAHVNLLINRAGYQPTPWERRQLEAAGA